MAATTTIRLPKLRARLASLARQTGRSAHSLIVEAVERHAAYEEQLRSLIKEAQAADAEMDKTGELYRAEDVHAWMGRLAARDSVRPQAVAQVVYSARALDHIERAFRFIRQENPSAAAAAAAIQSAADTLAAHPLVGHRIEGELRELVISYGQTGYIALYRFVIARAEVRILALRHQREIGFIP